MQLKGNELLIGESAFPCRVVAADREPPDVFGEAAALEMPILPRLGRRALKEGTLPESSRRFF